MKPKQKTAIKQIDRHEQALDLYFKNMLGDLLSTQAVPEPKVEVKTHSKPEIKRIPEPAPVVAKEVVAAQTRHVATKTEGKIMPLAVMPEWSQQEFQALFFKVDKMILAVPLTELLRTITFDRKVTKIPEQPSWFMGLMDELDSRIGVLDSGQLILGKSRGRQRNMQDKPYTSILITADGRWGLACDGVLSIGKLTPEKVRWRTGRKRRPWLVGTVIDELIAVIDIQKLVPHRKNEV